MNLEGAASGAFQTIMLIGIQDPKVLAAIDLFTERLHGALLDRVQRTIGAGAGDFDISLRVYGWNEVTGEREEVTPAAPSEVGSLFVVNACTQEIEANIDRTGYVFVLQFTMWLSSEHQCRRVQC